MVYHDKVIIGVPVYNEERFIRQTLESLSNQVLQDFIVLIADNSSTDATPDICREVVSKDSRFKYHRHHGNLGAVANGRFLYENTDSPYFMWLGAHDMLATNYLHDQINILESDPHIALAYSYTQWIDELGNSTRITDGGNFVHDDSSGMARYVKTIRGPWHECTAVNGLFRRSALSGVKFYYNFAGPDHLILTRAQFFGRFHRSDEPIYQRREFKSRNQDYMQRITGNPAASNELPFAKKMRPLCFAQIRDYWSLPVHFMIKLRWFAVLLVNLEHSYALFWPIRKVMRTILPDFMLKHLKKLGRVAVKILNNWCHLEIGRLI